MLEDYKTHWLVDTDAPSIRCLPVTLLRPGSPGLSLMLPAPGIIVITDGVTSVPDVAVCETLLNQLRSGTVACSFVQVRTFWEGGEGSVVYHKVGCGWLLSCRQ